MRIVFVLISSPLLAGCASSNTVKLAQGGGVKKTYAHTHAFSDQELAPPEALGALGGMAGAEGIGSEGGGAGGVAALPAPDDVVTPGSSVTIPPRVAVVGPRDCFGARRGRTMRLGVMLPFPLGSTNLVAISSGSMCFSSTCPELVRGG